MLLKKYKTEEVKRTVTFCTKEMKNEFIDECSKISNLPENQKLSESSIDDFLIKVVNIFEVNPIFSITVQKMGKNCWSINDLFLVFRFDFENSQIMATGGERGVFTKTFIFNSNNSSFESIK